MPPDAAPAAEIPGERLLLRRVRPEDRGPLMAILEEPEVARWWSPRGAPVALESLYSNDEIGYVIEVDGQTAGAISYYEENDPDYRHAGIDLFLGERWHGRGLGPAAIRALAGHLIHDRGHQRLIIDPALSNERAIRAYEKVGFRRVGVMRAYERGADGTWHDGLLMDLLAEEFEA